MVFIGSLDVLAYDAALDDPEFESTPGRYKFWNTVTIKIRIWPWTDVTNKYYSRVARLRLTKALWLAVPRHVAILTKQSII